MLLEATRGNRDLPSSLIIITPSAHPLSNLEEVSDQPPEHPPDLHDSASLSTSSLNIMASPTEKRSRIDIGAVWKRSSRGSGTQDQDSGLGSTASGNSSPSPASPNSSSQFRLWSLRRAVSASSPGPGSPQSPLESISPSSPQGFQRRPSRISSFIRRHHSTPKLEDSQDQGIPSSLRPGIPPVQMPQLPYNGVSSQPTLNQNVESTLFSTSQPEVRPQWLLHTQSHNSFSPVAANPFQEWDSKPRPHTASPSPVVASMNKPLPPLPQPLRGFSNPSTSATQPGSSSAIIDSPKTMEAEPEGFTSPTEFALFAEATSSFSFLPSTFEAVPSTSPSPQPFTQSQQYQSQSQTLPLPPRHHIPLPQLITPRSRSVPPTTGPIHHRSSSSTARMPMPVRRASPPQPLPQLSLRNPSQYSSSQHPPTRTQLIAEALEAIDDEEMMINSGSQAIGGGNGNGTDDELPDYATSQAEASARQRSEATRRARELEENWLRGRAERTRKPWRAWDNSDASRY